MNSPLFWHQGDAGAIRDRRPLGVLAGQQAIGQRVVGEQRQAELIEQPKDFPLGLAPEQRVVVLHAGKPWSKGEVRQLSQLLDGDVRASKCAHLSLRHELAHGAERVSEWDARVGSMELVEVDPVRAEPVQAALA